MTVIMAIAQKGGVEFGLIVVCERCCVMCVVVVCVMCGEFSDIMAKLWKLGIVFSLFQFEDFKWVLRNFLHALSLFEMIWGIKSIRIC